MEKAKRGNWVAIILAAGSSSRMGHPKQLIEIGGETLIKKTTTQAQQAGAKEIIVVAGHDSEPIKKELESISVHFAMNPNPEKGMGSSLKCGLKFVSEKFPLCNAVMILVCDQPLLNSVHLKKLVDTFEQTGGQIVASFYSRRNGVPALFHKSMFEKLLMIEDQQGAKKIIEQNSALVKSIDFPEGAVDLDTPEDLANFK